MSQKETKSVWQASELAAKAGGELKANPEKNIKGVRGAPEADPDYLTYAEDENFLKLARENKAGLILLTRSLYQESELALADVPLLLVDNPRTAFAQLANLFPDKRYLAENYGQESSKILVNQGEIAAGARVSPAAELEEGVTVMSGAIIGPGVKIGARSRIAAGVILVADIEIGQDCLFHPGVKVMPGAIIGDKVEIQAGAVIGSDGFGYASDEERHHKVPQQGKVVIEDEVEIGALTAIDRGVAGETRIGAGSKIDNLVQIAHNVKLGPGSLVAGQSGIAGSTELGARTTLAGQVGVEDHLKIGEGVTITGKAKVSRDLEEGGYYSGIPAQEHRTYLKQQAHFRRLDKLKQQIQELEKRLDQYLPSEQ